LLCAVLRAEQAAYRFGGITLAIVMWVPRTGPAWQYGAVAIRCGVHRNRGGGGLDRREKSRFRTKL